MWVSCWYSQSHKVVWQTYLSYPTAPSLLHCRVLLVTTQALSFFFAKEREGIYTGGLVGDKPRRIFPEPEESPSAAATLPLP